MATPEDQNSKSASENSKSAEESLLRQTLGSNNSSSGAEAFQRLFARLESLREELEEPNADNMPDAIDDENELFFMEMLPYMTVLPEHIKDNVKNKILQEVITAWIEENYDQ